MSNIQESAQNSNPDSQRPLGLRTGVSRVRACAHCKKHKIKCNVRPGDQSCIKCLRLGVACVPYDPALRLLAEDAAWKETAILQIDQLQDAMRAVLQHARLPDLSQFGTKEEAESPNSPRTTKASDSSDIPVSVDMRSENITWDQQGEPGLVPGPMRSLYELTEMATARGSAESRPRRTRREGDVITKGIISLAEGEFLFKRFLENHSPFLWGGVVFSYRSLDAVRRSSALLTTSVLTVAALHTPNCTQSLDKCYHAFVSITGNACLETHTNLEDIRGLCIAAFYLPNLSWRLCGMAAKMGTEMDIHRSFRKLMAGDTSQHERVRLWYMLYVCDRQQCIAYGRPSAIQDDDAIRGVEDFIQCPSTKSGDIRLSAQVALFRILTEAHQEYGNDQSQRLSEESIERIRNFNFAIEKWRLTWQPLSVDDITVGSYPSKGLALYYHFARFQLNSLALRGVRQIGTEILSLERQDAAMVAVSAARSTLTHVLREKDLRRALPGVPIFTHAMVAFCATFVLKLAAVSSWAGEGQSPGLGLGFDLSDVLRLTRQSIDVLSEVAGNVGEKHIITLIIAGLKKLLEQSSASIGEDVDESAYAEHRYLNRHRAHRRSEVSTGSVMEDSGTSNYNMGEHLHNMEQVEFNGLINMLQYGFNDTITGQVSMDDTTSWATPLG